MSRSVLIACALGAALLGGCRGKTVDEMSYTEIKQLAVVIAKRCEDQGVKYPSPEWDICTRQEVNREVVGRQRDQIRMRRALASFGSGLQGVSQGYYRAAATSRANRPVTCHSNPAPTGRYSVSCY